MAKNTGFFDTIARVYTALLVLIIFIVSIGGLVIAVFYGYTAFTASSYDEQPPKAAVQLDTNNFSNPPERKVDLDVDGESLNNSVGLGSIKNNSEDLVLKFQDAINDILVANTLKNRETGQPFYFFDSDSAKGSFSYFQNRFGRKTPDFIEKLIDYTREIFSKPETKKYLITENALSLEEFVYYVFDKARIQYIEQQKFIREEKNRIALTKLEKEQETRTNLIYALAGLGIVFLMSLLVLLSRIEANLRVYRKDS